jgi:hypothetical protein
MVEPLAGHFAFEVEWGETAFIPPFFAMMPGNRRATGRDEKFYVKGKQCNKSQ